MTETGAPARPAAATARTPARTPRLPTPIEAHRLLSSQRSAALLTADGAVDWWCAPQVDSPPLCWALLDDDGGCARWRGARPVERQ
ncbi:MAG: DUF5911 domain-containing protein, partial [Actinomycetota bacterium]|nr:DUF5911 domain-containing protein [Actinomycetota bacterium]